MVHSIITYSKSLCENATAVLFVCELAGDVFQIFSLLLLTISCFILKGKAAPTRQQAKNLKAWPVLGATMQALEMKNQ